MLRVDFVSHVKGVFVYLGVFSDMPHARQDFKITPEIFLDRVGFGWALYDD